MNDTAPTLLTVKKYRVNGESINVGLNLLLEGNGIAINRYGNGFDNIQLWVLAFDEPQGLRAEWSLDL